VNGKLPVVTLLLCLSCFAYTKAASSRTWAPGVSKGDFFYYEMYGVYTSSKANATIKVPPFEHNNTDWVRIDIIGVSGSIVYQVYTLHFKNGTESKFDLQTDLTPSSAGSFNPTKTGVPLCAANLGVGDPLPTVQFTLNETLIRTYPSGERETNLVSWDSPEDWGRCYFDKKTGILVELYRVHKFTNRVTGEAIEKADHVELTRSNLWEITEFPTTLAPIFIAIITVTLLLLAIATRKQKSTKKNTNSPL